MMLLYHGDYSGEFTIISHRALNILGRTSLKFLLSYKILQLASTALNFDTVRILADFPLAYKHSNLNFRHCNLVQPSSKLAAEALLSETGNKPICIKYFVIVCFLSTHLFIYVYKRADKNFEIQTNLVLGINKRTNISKKKSNMQFSEV